MSIDKVENKPMKMFVKPDKIYPKLTTGLFRNLKYLSMIVLLCIYYVSPFLRWDRGPHLPNQAILIDLVGQRGYFFGIEIWPQEVYLLVGILILSAIGLFFSTALFGRIWCGYACPQTVWTDFFVWVERLFQGDRNARKKLDEGPWNFNKLWRKTATHIFWLVIGAATGGAWVLYFNDAPTIIEEIRHLDLSTNVLIWIIALTLSTYIMAGFAREQVCMYMCPYARFQSAMFDRDTLIISYAVERGEPRGKHKKGDTWEGRGHCVDCDACVQVCPTGIDIRDGLQFDCISCGLCIDACNKVMKKLELPKGLIHYDTENNQLVRASSLARGEKPTKGRMRWIRPRTIAYFLILSIIGSLMTAAIILRKDTQLNVIHNRSPQFVRLSNGDVRNNYMVKILNKSHDDRAYSLKVKGIAPKSIVILGAGDVIVSDLKVHANAVGEFRVLITTAPTNKDRSNIRFVIKDTKSLGTNASGIAHHDNHFIEH